MKRETKRQRQTERDTEKGRQRTEGGMKGGREGRKHWAIGDGWLSGFHVLLFTSALCYLYGEIEMIYLLAQEVVRLSCNQAQFDTR